MEQSLSKLISDNRKIINIEEIDKTHFVKGLKKILREPGNSKTQTQMFYTLKVVSAVSSYCQCQAYMYSFSVLFYF